MEENAENTKEDTAMNEISKPSVAAEKVNTEALSPEKTEIERTDAKREEEGKVAPSNKDREMRVLDKEEGRTKMKKEGRGGVG